MTETGIAITRLKQLESVLLLAYAASLPLSLTLSWGLLIAGLVLRAGILIADCASQEGGSAELVRRARSLGGAPLAVPLAAFAAAVAASGLATGGLAEAWRSVLSLKALIVYFWAYGVFRDYDRLPSVSVGCLLVLGAVAGLWGTIQQVTGFHPFGYPYLQGTGFLSSPMAYAGQMQLLGMLGLGMALGGGQVKLPGLIGRRAVLLLLVLANCLGILFASERSAWLGAVAGAAAVALAVSWRALARAVVALAVVAACAWLFVPVVQQRLAPLTDWEKDVSTRVRLVLWRESVSLWRESPWLGIGVRNFPHFDIPEAIVPGRSRDINHAHSNYVHILATTGLLGLGAFLWIWLAALSRAWAMARGAAEGAWERSLGLGLLGGIVALMVAGLFEYNFGTAQVRLAQWFLLSLMLPGRSSSRRQSDAREPAISVSEG